MALKMIDPNAFEPKREQKPISHALKIIVSLWSEFEFNTEAVDTLGVAFYPWVKFAVDEDHPENIYVIPTKKEDPQKMKVIEKDGRYYVIASNLFKGLGIDIVPGETKFELIPDYEKQDDPVYLMKRIED